MGTRVNDMATWDQDDLRNALAALYKGPIRHKSREDEVGPFTIHYEIDQVGFYLGVHRLGGWKGGGNAEAAALTMLTSLKTLWSQVDARATALWPEFQVEVLDMQASAPHDEQVSWPQVKELVGNGHGRHAREKWEATTMYLLGKLREGGVPLWSVSYGAPALSQQKDAVSVPRHDKPGYPDRVYWIRLFPTR